MVRRDEVQVLLLVLCLEHEQLLPLVLLHVVVVFLSLASVGLEGDGFLGFLTRLAGLPVPLSTTVLLLLLLTVTGEVSGLPAVPADLLLSRLLVCLAFHRVELLPRGDGGPIDVVTSILIPNLVVPVSCDEFDLGHPSRAVLLTGTDLVDDGLGLGVEILTVPGNVCPETHEVGRAELGVIPEQEHQDFVRYLEVRILLPQCLPPGIKPGNKLRPSLPWPDLAPDETSPQPVHLVVLIIHQLLPQEVLDHLHGWFLGLLVGEHLHHQRFQTELVTLVVISYSFHDNSRLGRVGQTSPPSCLPDI